MYIFLRAINKCLMENQIFLKYINIRVCYALSNLRHIDFVVLPKQRYNKTAPTEQLIVNYIILIESMIYEN